MKLALLETPFNIECLSEMRRTYRHLVKFMHVMVTSRMGMSRKIDKLQLSASGFLWYGLNNSDLKEEVQPNRSDGQLINHVMFG